MRWTDSDTAMMRRALDLAARGIYTTRPNPRVGCVLVNEGQVVGEGMHLRAGEPHAEVHALRDAGEQARGATAYVTLEPCAHHGRTPPCADALVQAGVSRVVAAVLDPNPEVAGRGLQRLRDAGISVASGLLEREATAMNAGFLARHGRGRPWLRLKVACSLDGRTALADGTSKWITGPAARQDVQHWRASSCAILTSVHTVLADDPAHNVRIDTTGAACAAADSDIPQPMRVIVDSSLRTPAEARILQPPGRTVIVCGEAAAPDAAAGLEAAGAELLRAPREDLRIDLGWLFEWLAHQQVNEVMTEAGPTLLGALLNADLVDELLWYLAPNLLGASARPAVDIGVLQSMSRRPEFTLLEHVALGADLRLRFTR